MKSLSTLLSLVALLILSTVSASSFAESNSASLGASATIVVPATMAKTSDLMINMPLNGESTNNTSSSRGRKHKGNNNINADVVAASFTVSGYANYTYSVNVPSSFTIRNGNNSITIGTEMGSATRSLSADGIDNLSISGKVTFDNNTSAIAINTNKDEQFPVTIVYN